VAIMKKGIFYYRNNLLNSVEIERKLGIPPRTLRRYTAFSRDSESKFYLDETEPEKMVKEADSISYEELMKIHMELSVPDFDMKAETLNPDLLDII